jgi:choline dehydrogenase-like flavoprotein
VASRLSEVSRSTVALIEAGGEDRNFWINLPLGFGKLYNEPSINWNYESEPEVGLNGVKSYQPRGKVIGGTGSINGMVYMRAAPQEYDEWRDLGNPGWGFEDVLPYFKKSERNERGESKFHGARGPLNVTDGQAHELGSAFMSAARECGFAVTQDHCGEHHEGFGVPQYNIKNGRRNSTAKAFLRPARRRSNLNVITDSVVSRIVMKNGAAVGVEIIRDGKSDVVHARREVVLCAGVFNTPQLLQVSGLGPGAALQDAGVSVLKDIPGIGADLEDHFGANLAFSCRAPITITDAVNHPVKRLLMALQYFASRGGHLATPGTYCTGFFRSTPSSGRVDSHISIAGWARSGPGKASNNFGLLPYPAYSLIASILRPYTCRRHAQTIVVCGKLCVSPVS